MTLSFISAGTVSLQQLLSSLSQNPESIGIIRKHIPSLTWANYPPSITTPDENSSEQIRKLIRHRRKTGVPDLDAASINNSNLDELRKIAIFTSQSSLKAKRQSTLYRVGSDAIKRYVLLRSKGICEGFNKPAPFKRPDGSPYLEPHHTIRRADDGPDHPKHVIALCPNCHRRAEYASDSKTFNARLKITYPNLSPIK